MAKVKIIQKTGGRINRKNGGVITDKLRVTAYCRVKGQDDCRL